MAPTSAIGHRQLARYVVMLEAVEYMFKPQAMGSPARLSEPEDRASSCPTGRGRLQLRADGPQHDPFRYHVNVLA